MSSCFSFSSLFRLSSNSRTYASSSLTLFFNASLKYGAMPKVAKYLLFVSPHLKFLAMALSGNIDENTLSSHDRKLLRAFTIFSVHRISAFSVSVFVQKSVIFTTGTLPVCSVKFNFSGLDNELSVEAATALLVFADARKHDIDTAGSLALSNSMCFFPFALLLRADSPIIRKSIFFLHKQQKQEYLYLYLFRYAKESTRLEMKMALVGECAF